MVLLTPHLGCFEIAAQAYASASATVRTDHRAVPAGAPGLAARADGRLARPARAWRRRPPTLAGVRQMMRALRRGEAVGLLPDQVPPEGMGVWAPFFGRPAYTMTLAARLAQQTGAALLLAWGERLPRGARLRGALRSRCDEPLPADPTAQAESAARRSTGRWSG